MTKEEAKASLVVGGIYESPYSGKQFKMLPESLVTRDSVHDVATCRDYNGEWILENGFAPYFYYEGKGVVRIDSQQHTMEFEQKQLPIFN
jgi:hypothetical protein